MTKLTGADLINTARGLAEQGHSEREIAIQCGYFSAVEGSDEPRALTQQFLRALNEANGIAFAKPSAPVGPTYVRANGLRQVVIGARVLPDIAPYAAFIVDVDSEGVVHMEPLAAEEIERLDAEGRLPKIRERAAEPASKTGLSKKAKAEPALPDVAAMAA
jgi:hypothetical protein